ncbi:MAG TPA: hypothetical protein VNA69_04025 [Thermoanaerobaculia bacterium]|nr:hypothetical protein [Thermoanaerobaculia bacterium]
MDRQDCLSSTRAREELRLELVPHVPLAIDALERAVAHARLEDLVDAVAQRGVLAREDDDVVAFLDRLVEVRVEAGDAAHLHFGDDVVEEDGVEPSLLHVFVRVHGVVVRDGGESDVEVAALHGLVDRRERDLHEQRLASEAFCDFIRDFDVEADELRRIVRVRFDVRRAALGVTAPAEDFQSVRRPRQEDEENDER